jgi:hypothetical protein
MSGHTDVNGKANPCLIPDGWPVEAAEVTVDFKIC